jgi:hypothetical protein
MFVFDRAEMVNACSNSAHATFDAGSCKESRRLVWSVRLVDRQWHLDITDTSEAFELASDTEHGAREALARGISDELRRSIRSSWSGT